MLKDFISLLFPRTCLVSHRPLAKGETYIATETALSLPTFTLSEPNVALERRVYSFSPVQQAWAYYKFSKHGKVQKLLHVLKYRGYPEIGKLAGQWFGQSLMQILSTEDIDLIVPVPLHKRKKQSRGYNQCDYIAQGLSEVLGIPWSGEILLKKYHTQSQTRKSRMARYQNSQQVFTLQPDTQLTELHILLVDDVVTTGATLGACANVLLSGGCRAVSIAALATPE